MINRSTWTLITGGVVVVTLTAGIYLASTSSKTPHCAGAGTTLLKSETAKIDGFSLRELGMDGVMMEATARQASLKYRRFKGFRIATGRVVELDGPCFKVYGDGGRFTELRAAGAVLDPARRTVTFTGAASVVTSDGVGLRADSLTWRYARAEIVVEGCYTLTGKGREVRGEGLEIDLDLNDKSRV